MNDLYVDDGRRILNPYRLDLEPEKGSRGYSRIPIDMKGIDKVARLIPAMMSTPNVDRYGEIVEPNAYSKWLPQFMDNPVVMANHVYAGPNGEPTSIGSWQDLAISDKGLSGKAKIMTDDPLADAWWRRIDQGVVRAFSVGFIAHNWEMREYKDAEGQKRKRRYFTEAELIECSVVNIPANRQSLILQNSFNRVAGVATEPAAIAKRLDAVDLALKNFEQLLKGYFSLDPGSPTQLFIQDVVEATQGSVGHRCGHVRSTGEDDPLGGVAKKLIDRLDAAIEGL